MARALTRLVGEGVHLLVREVDPPCGAPWAASARRGSGWR